MSQEVVEEFIDVLAPADGDRGSGDHVLEK